MGFEPDDTRFTKAVLWPTELRRHTWLESISFRDNLQRIRQVLTDIKTYDSLLVNTFLKMLSSVLQDVLKTLLIFLVRKEELESSTFWFEAKCSIRLSYSRVFLGALMGIEPITLARTAYETVEANQYPRQCIILVDDVGLEPTAFSV